MLILAYGDVGMRKLENIGSQSILTYQYTLLSFSITEG
jgi:hypothetical protein